MQTTYDRAAEDLGNIVHLEHVNVTMPDQRLATLFYVAGLGLTRDPYIMVSDTNMWINIGRSQVHMPNKAPQVLRGVVGLVTPDLKALAARLEAVAPKLAGTRFAYKVRADYIEATCPYGNLFRLHAPSPEYGPAQLAMPYVEFNVPVGTADGIVRFYREAIKAKAHLDETADRKVARIECSKYQVMLFRETSAPIPEYDGHHIQVYLADFSGPHRWLNERGLIMEESDQWQYRFLDIVDPVDARPLFRIEHEIRSMTHPLYARPLVNRNPAQTNRTYEPMHDAFLGTF
jgi:hypothetical protein